MENIIITKGNQMSEAGGKLNYMSLDYMAYPLVGSKDTSLIEKTFIQLWKLGSNN